MKTLPWIICAVLAVVALFGWFRPKEQTPSIHLRDTLIVRDTIHDSVPKPVLVRFDHLDTLPIYIKDIDTLRVRDSFYIPVPIERR